MKSIISFAERGSDGDNSYRGNCSGFVQQSLIEHFKINHFVDICEGGLTSRDVCKRMGVNYNGFDLKSGTDFTSDYILSLMDNNHCDMSFSHPPYHNMIKYSDDDNDLSNSDSVDVFLAKSQLMLMNQREITTDYYVTLIGDMRKNGVFNSFQSDFIKMMPRSELLSVVIKQQHNCLSDRRSYSGSFVPIAHEYLLIWKRSAKSFFDISMDKAIELRNMISITWSNAIRLVMMKLGKADLSLIYSEVEAVVSPLMLDKNKHWKAKIRQVLQKYYHNVERGVWQFS